MALSRTSSTSNCYSQGIPRFLVSNIATETIKTRGHQILDRRAAADSARGTSARLIGAPRVPRVTVTATQIASCGMTLIASQRARDHVGRPGGGCRGGCSAAQDPEQHDDRNDAARRVR
jgi:hypothetical protein